MFLNFSGKTFYLPNQKPLQQEIASLLNSYRASIYHFIFFSNGKLLQSFQNVQSLATIRAVVPLKGGKGGYGAKLKTQGGKKVRPNDNMFSRDIHGQKVVYATMEKEYKQFVKKKIEEDKLVAQERQQFKIMENTLREGQSFMKLDRTYRKQIETTEKSLIESIQIGRQRLMEKHKTEDKSAKQQVKMQEGKEEREEVEPSSVRQNQEQSNKRQLPFQFKEEVKDEVQKKVKIEELKPIVKPSFMSAQQKFKLLFKK